MLTANIWIHCFENITSNLLYCAQRVRSSAVERIKDSTSMLVMLPSPFNILMPWSVLLNQMAKLFESIIDSHWFLHTSIILFLKNIDVFKSKLLKVHLHQLLPNWHFRIVVALMVPLEKYFLEYTAEPDINKVEKYIFWRSCKANRARLRIYPQCFPIIVSLCHDYYANYSRCPHTTDATNIRLVFAAVLETILQKDSGILWYKCRLCFSGGKSCICLLCSIS